jgi:hypothetical protein
MSRAQKKLDKSIDDAIEAAFKVHFDRVQIPIMDIPRIYRIARERIAKGQTANEAMLKIRELYE